MLRNFGRAMVDDLARDYRLILVDRPGSGYSTRAPGASARLRVQAESIAELIRIPSINPLPFPGADGELRAARHIADRLADAGIPAEVIEPFPGRGSVHARLRGDGTGGEPLLLLSHLDVVPAPADLWTHDPFAGHIADGYLYGRGAVDMKDMVGLELGVVRMLAAEARAVAAAAPSPR